MIDINKKIRDTAQFELPVKKVACDGSYNIYPSFDIGTDLIQIGYDVLAKRIGNQSIIKIDGFVGVLFETVKIELNEAFLKLGITPEWINVSSALKSEETINTLIKPFLGGDDPVFGKIAGLDLDDFFDAEILNSLVEKKSDNPIIFYGIGAELVPVDGLSLYIDVSKNEIQYRSRAGSVRNIGASKPMDPKVMYKRFYFIDWVVLNKHKNRLKDDIDILIDGQRSEEITWVMGDDWRNAIQTYIKNPVRVRPWFEPGAWGGTWIGDHVRGLSENVINYAWSFEFIVPENGVVFESSQNLLEFSFDFLMYQQGDKILGEDFDTYKYEFPIRFDFLDTFDGGNLSIQCHPQLDYMKKHFGESITQEETYYILDKKENAQVYLGFHDNIDPITFESALKHSKEANESLDITKYVQAFDAEKHALYLIPPGTIHGSGKNNLVLEISSTPYIYTFKMYDWLRLGLDGKPRPINIERGMENLDFSKAGDMVKQELISTPKVISNGDGWSLEHLPTHDAHLYDVHRYSISTEVQIDTKNKAHILSLVEGESLTIEVDGKQSTFSYAESFLIPATINHYAIINPGKGTIKVIKAFIK